MGIISNMPMALHCGNSQCPVLYMLDDCGDTSTITDWVETNDGLNPVDETTLIKEGSHSMALGVDADKSGPDYAIWTNTQAQGNLSSYQHDWIYLWVHLSTLNHLGATECFRYRIGSGGGTDHLRFHFNKDEFVVGWNLVQCDLDNPTTTIGAVDWTAIDYSLIMFMETVGNTNDFTGYIDSIMFVRP